VSTVKQWTNEHLLKRSRTCTTEKNTRTQRN